MSIKTKQFWLKVGEEVSNERDFLCILSPTFRKQWRNGDNKQLMNLGKLFLSNTKQNPAFIVKDDGCVLFNTITGSFDGPSWSKLDYDQLRIDFIQWCINKFE